MIENQTQYEVAKGQAERLEAGLARLLEGRFERRIADPLLEETAHAGVRQILASLHAEISEYERRLHEPGNGSSPVPAEEANR